jgi:hypothetical protein
MPSPIYYKKGLDDANTATIDGQFVALYGMEWGVISSGGHVLVYGFDSLCGWDFGASEIQIPEANYNKLFSTINRKTGSFAFLAHPQSTDFSNLFTQAYNSTADEAIAGIAIRSGPAFSTNNTYSNPSTSNFVNRYNDALKRGYHLGPGIDHDTHNSVFGRQTKARTVVLSPILNRAEIINAIKQRRFYASDDWNIEVNFNVNNMPMGSIITQTGNPTLEVIINDGDAETASSITVYNGITGSGNNPTILATVNNTNTLTYTHNINNNQSYYYYLYIEQSDGDKIWTSPIWYTRNDNINIQSPVADFIDTLTICANNPVQLQDNSTNGPNAWWWTANGAYPNNSSLQHPTFSFPVSGTYQITLVASNTAGVDTITKNIFVQTSPIIIISGVESICKGTSASLLSSGANNYLWSNGTLGANNIVSPLSNTSYTVTGYVNSCYDTATIQLNVFQQIATPTITSIYDTLFSSSEIGNQWYYYYNPILGATNQKYVPTVTGIYQTQVTDSVGCKSDFSLPYGVVLGIAENASEAANNFTIYPNPSSGTFHISSIEPFQNIEIEVSTIIGYLVHKQTLTECSFNKPAVIDLSYLRKGLYLLKIRSVNGFYEHKIKIE